MTSKSTLESFLYLYDTREKGKDITSVFEEMYISDKETREILSTTIAQLEDEREEYLSDRYMEPGIVGFATTGVCGGILKTFAMTSIVAIGLGLVVGIPVSYWMYKRQQHQRQQDYRAREKRIKEDACERFKYVAENKKIDAELMVTEHNAKTKKLLSDTYQVIADHPFYLTQDDLDERGIPRDKRYIN